jgi:hypothetical protein
MNVKLDWNCDFLGICIFDDKIFPNHFFVELQMITNTESSKFQNVAFERMKCIITSMFNNSIFMSASNSNFESLINLFPGKMVLFPDEAFDQIVGLAIFCKINAVMENLLICSRIRISSTFGDNVWYEYAAGDELGPFALAKSSAKKKKYTPWWHKSNTLLFDVEDKESEEEYLTWDDLELNFVEDSDEELEIEFVPEKQADVIDMNISRNKNKRKNKSTAKFKVEVVEGGKKPDEN